MKVQEVMEPNVRSCTSRDDLGKATKLMGEAGCGVLPVVSEGARIVGILTDRDICLALGRRDERPSQIPVREVMHTDVHACQPGDDVQRALDLMRRWKVRRLPVLDDGMLVGIVSLDELVLKAQLFDTKSFHGPLLADIGTTLRAICEHEPAALH